jgi:hypothetical protein
MRSFGIVAFVVLSALLAFAGRARAVTEFCPADIVTWQAVSPDNSGPLSQAGPSTLYALQLSALSSRTLDAVLVIETDAGWFSTTLSAVQLTRAVTPTETRGDPEYMVRFLSPPVYVQFPSPVQVQRMWVRSATVSSDASFLWAGKGRFECAPRSSEALNTWWVGPVLTHTLKALRAAPLPNAQRATVVAMTPPDGLGCSKPFVSATATHPSIPAFPEAARVNGESYVVDVAVAIDAAGRVVDAWPVTQFADADAGTNALVTATIDAARKSSYSPAIALCHPVPGTYLFRADFDSPTR